MENQSFDRSGLVYPEFDESVHVIEPFDVPLKWQDNISIDPGLHNPLSAHWYAVDYDGNVYVVAEHYEAGKDIQYHSERIREISERLGWHTTAKGRIEALIDSSAAQHTLAGTKSVSELFYERKFLVNTNVNKDVISGISQVKEFLKKDNGKPNLYIFKNCVNMIREIKTYQWGDNGFPAKKDDHAMDELRYFIMAMPEVKEKKI